MIETSVFRHRGYSAGLGCVVVFFAGMAGTLLTLTVYLQFGEHFSAIRAGLTLAPFAAGSAVGAVLAATVVVPRLGRAGLQVAAVLIGAGAWWLRDIIAAHGLATSSAELIPAQLVLGAGIGMLISPLFDFILASVRDHEVGSASGVLNAVQQLAGAIGVAAIGSIFFSTLSRTASPRPSARAWRSSSGSRPCSSGWPGRCRAARARMRPRGGARLSCPRRPPGRSRWRRPGGRLG